MQPSADVVTGLATFYDRFSSHDPNLFADALATGPGVSVIGSAPGEGIDTRDDWIAAYTEVMKEAELRLEGGPDPRGFQHGGFGFAIDTPRFVLPDGTYIPTRLTAVMRRENGWWKVVHLHFSVGVPDEEATRSV